MQTWLTDIWKAYKQETDVDKKIIYYFCYYVLGGKQECDKKLREAKSWVYAKAYFMTFMLLRRYMYSDCNNLHILSELITVFNENNIYFDDLYSYDLVSEIVLNTIDKKSQLIIHKDERWYSDLNIFFKNLFNSNLDFDFLDKRIREFNLIR